MAVLTTIPLVTNQPLVRVSDLDPKRLFVFAGGSGGDGSGGTHEGRCTFPLGFGYLIVHIGAQMDASSTSNVIYSITENGLATFMDAGDATAVDVLNQPHCPAPPPILYLDEPIVVGVFSDNTNAETLLVRCVAFAWDLQDARNIPQKFMWPGTLG